VLVTRGLNVYGRTVDLVRDNVGMVDRHSHMPRVWDLSFEEAQQALRAVGLAFAVHRAQSQVVPEGALIAASPPPGSEIDDGTEIVLTVSSGPPRSNR